MYRASLPHSAYMAWCWVCKHEWVGLSFRLSCYDSPYWETLSKQTKKEERKGEVEEEAIERKLKAEKKNTNEEGRHRSWRKETQKTKGTTRKKKTKIKKRRRRRMKNEQKNWRNIKGWGGWLSLFLLHQISPHEGWFVIGDTTLRIHTGYTCVVIMLWTCSRMVLASNIYWDISCSDLGLRLFFLSMSKRMPW
jgi:hypothetical protein